MSNGPTEPNATPTKKNKKTKVNFNKQYVMNHQSRPKLGRAVIFNNETFEDRIPSLTNREGSGEDVESLVAILRRIRFEIDEKKDVCKDFTDVEAIEKLEELGNENFSEHNCFFAVFLSHGDSGKLLMRKRELNIQGHILDHFRGNTCESLSGKPKIFLFQACRGNHIEEAVDGVDDDGISAFLEEPTQLKPTQQPQKPALEATEETEDQIIVPSGADFLICYASAEGYKAHRYASDKTKEKKEKIGSWFIQTFVDVMNQYIDDLKKDETKEQDFLSLMTVVVDTVANISMNDNNAECKIKKRVQIPSISSTLRKRIYFPNLTNPRPAEADKNPVSDIEPDTEDQTLEIKIETKSKSSEQMEENFAHLTPKKIDVVSPTEDIKAEEFNFMQESSSKTADTQENQAHNLESAPNKDEFPSENVQAEELNSAANETRNIQKNPAKSPDLSPNSIKFISPLDDTEPEKQNPTNESANGSEGAHPLKL